MITPTSGDLNQPVTLTGHSFGSYHVTDSGPPCSKQPTEPVWSTHNSQPATTARSVTPPAPQLGDMHHRHCVTQLLTRIVTWLHNGLTCQLCYTDRRPINDTEGRTIVTELYQNPTQVRTAKRSISNARIMKGRDERVTKGVDGRFRTPPVPHQHAHLETA